MRDQNRVSLKGTVSKEVTTATSKNGLAIANIPISTTQSRQNGNDITTYHTIVCFGELAEMAASFQLGDRVSVEGSIQNDSYEKDGQRIRVTKVKASHLDKLFSEAVDAPAGNASPKKEDSANFPLGEASKPTGFPFLDSQRQINWEKPGPEDNGCSPVVEQSGVHMTCRWEDPENPLSGGIVYGMKDGEESWTQLGTIPNTVDLPF
tara:strand:+ start:6312 stop:6932 length:621 start_codon:yes stop_codon:yes gene_type:complete